MNMEHVSHPDIVKVAAKILSLPKTAANLLHVIAKEKGLFISDIIRKMKMSERCVRHHLKILSERGLLKRTVEITRNKRLSYRYSLAKIKGIEQVLKSEISRKIKEINYAIANTKKHAI
jgi:predicted DNA-binding transcriptional regulator